ncbi:MAG: DUF2333 family protein [Candidatus Tectimicrobiota bacterium]
MEGTRPTFWIRSKQAGKSFFTSYHPRNLKAKGWLGVVWRLLAVVLVVLLGLSFWWGREPGMFSVREAARVRAENNAQKLVPGYITAATLARVAETLLDKPGGYLSNDMTLPGALMDNIPNWEFGVLVQVRDLAHALRNSMSRSQTQSMEDPDLAEAEPRFQFRNDAWGLPSSEREYRAAIQHLKRYMERLTDTAQPGTQFFARSDNLRDWLAVVEKRLGGLSQRLSASVVQHRVNTDLAGEIAARQATQTADDITVKTPWWEIDDAFYEARGSTWALIHFLQAVEVDFAPVLQLRNALVSLRQIIRELEATQHTLWSPAVLNGRGFGFVANYSLIMTSYISRANAAIIDLRTLLAGG